MKAKDIAMGRLTTKAETPLTDSAEKPKTVAPESPTGTGVDVEQATMTNAVEKARLVASLPNSLAQEPVPQSQPQAPGTTKRPATMMEVIGWEITLALYRAHRLCVSPPTAKQVKKKRWPEGQHKKILIETAELLTSLLVVVGKIIGEKAQQKAKELMNEQNKQRTSRENPKRIDTVQEGNSGRIVLEGESPKGGELGTNEFSPPPSRIIIPEGFGH